MTETPSPPAIAPARRRAPLVLTLAVATLALVETATALVAPRFAPDDADWRAAAAHVRAGFRPGDLIVAAPPWADQLMRLHLGDLVPVTVAARLDGARFPRVWEIGQRGAAAPETADGRTADRRRFGALSVRLVERAPLAVTFDFVAGWEQARVLRREPGRDDVVCTRQADGHQCPDLGFNFVRPQLLEIDTTPRFALYAQPVGGATVVIEHDAAPLGRELAVGTGLHHVWHRRNGDGTVVLRVFVDDREVLRQESGNRTGWQVSRVDTTAWDGKPAAVRFEITSERPVSRHFGFAAEARR